MKRYAILLALLITGAAQAQVTHQGGADGKDCDTADIPVGVATQVASDNAGDPFDGLPAWSYVINGQFELANSGRRPVNVSVDTYVGDQTYCGANTDCYWHQTPVRTAVPARGSLVIPYVIWENVGCCSFDYQAFYVTVTAVGPLTCAAGTNAYVTTEEPAQ
jgi:hypothetical protein